MKKFNKTLTAAEIRNANIDKNSVLGKAFQWINNEKCYFLCIDGERRFCFSCENDVTKSINKIKKMGFGFGWRQPSNTDEEKGIIQAGLNGENPFAYSIICANPEYNEVVK